MLITVHFTILFPQVATAINTSSQKVRARKLLVNKALRVLTLQDKTSRSTKKRVLIIYVPNYYLP